MLMLHTCNIYEPIIQTDGEQWHEHAQGRSKWLESALCVNELCWCHLLRPQTWLLQLPSPSVRYNKTFGALDIQILKIYLIMNCHLKSLCWWRLSMIHNVIILCSYNRRWFDWQLILIEVITAVWEQKREKTGEAWVQEHQGEWLKQGNRTFGCTIVKY